MILYINGNYPHHSLHCELVYKLAELGESITVFVPMKETKLEGKYRCSHPKVKIIYSNCLKTIDSVFFIHKTIKIAKRIEQEVDMTKVESVLAGTMYSDGVVAYLLHKKYHMPYSFAVRQTDITYQMKWRPYLNGLIRKILENATNIIFLSHAYKRYIDRFEIKEKKYQVIPNAVNDYWFDLQKHSRIIHNPISLIYVGEITKNKNLSTTIQTVALLNNENIPTCFHIIGSGPEENSSKQLANRLGIADKVFFHGWKTEKEAIKKAYDQSDIFIMPSYKETFGTVYIEALTQGLPIIYTKNQGIDGYFDDGSVGYSCSPTDINDIASKIKLIIHNYESISKRCFDQSNRFTWNIVARQYKDVLDNMRVK